jgi:hypothetical protein
MEEDYVTPRRREGELKSRAGRRSRWLSRKWKVSRKGNEYLVAYGYRVTIYPLGYGAKRVWGGTIVEISTGRERRSTKQHESSDHAKLAAFDTIETWR